MSASDEEPEFQSFLVQLVRARTEWCCDNCSRTIQKGEVYERDEVRYGAYYTVRYCQDCGAMLSR
jgi:hypothetical protein